MCSILHELLKRHKKISSATFTRSMILLSILFMAILASASFAQTKLITYEDMKIISPRANDDLAKALADSQKELEAAGITTRLRAAHFIAQVMTETGGLKRIDENLNYSRATLLRVFSRRTISEAKASELAGKPREIANWVYGARLGNLGRHTDDGWNYRGSGFLQLTGRANFRDRGNEIGLPLEENPDLVRRPREGMLAALAYWTSRNMNAIADGNDRRRVRMMVNGPAAHGYEQSVYWFNKAWTQVFRDKDAAGFERDILVEFEAADEEALFNQMMVESGILPSVSVESGQRQSSIKAFQRELGLPETGELDEATRDALLDPLEWRYREDTEQMPSNSGSNVNSSVVINLSQDANAEQALPAVEGSGEILSNPSMPQEVQLQYETATATYADYETGRVGVEPGWYIPFSVIGDDDRVVITDTTTFPERAIVQILFDDGFGGRSLCSGAMISEDTVLTAAHCIHSGTVAGRAFSNFRVLPGRNRGAAPFGICSARSAYLLRGWTEAPNELEARYFDLGALKLDCEIGERTGWLGVRSVSNQDLGLPTKVQGYAADKSPPGRQWTSEDTLRVLGDLKGFYKNDTYGGTSGAPVFIGSDTMVLTGIHTNGVFGDEEPWDSHNAFTAVTPERLAQIKEWIVGE